MDTESFSSTRREFLCGTAAAIGVAALGLEAGPVQAKAAASAAPLSIAYWTGKKLVDARWLSAGDASLTMVRLTIHGHQDGEGLWAIDAHFPIEGQRDPTTTRFHAWTTSTNMGHSSRFTMPVTPGDGLLLSILAEKETFCGLRTDAAPGQPKLRSGHYVLALGEPAWLACRFNPDALHQSSGPLTLRTLSGFVPARFGYRVVTVERI